MFADYGIARSQCNLGVRYINGAGVRRNVQCGAELYRRAAQQQGAGCHLVPPNR